MEKSDSPWSVVLTTTDSEALANTIAAALVEAQLAACVSIFPIRSVYSWQGQIHKNGEWQLLIKTRQRQFEAVSEKVRSLHTYDTPELIALSIDQGSADYLRWMNETIKPTTKP